MKTILKLGLLAIVMLAGCQTRVYSPGGEENNPNPAPPHEGFNPGGAELKVFTTPARR